MKQIYFLCTGNSCRSQMAEGFAKQIMGSKWQVKSAGLETHGLNPLAVQVMAENNIDISSQFSKLIDTDFLFSSDLVVTLCGDARDRCTVTPSSVKKLHWPLRDPAQANGTQEEILTVFRKVRDEIEVRVLELKAELELEK